MVQFDKTNGDILVVSWSGGAMRCDVMYAAFAEGCLVRIVKTEA